MIDGLIPRRLPVPTQTWLPAALLVVAAAGWWWTLVSARNMSAEMDMGGMSTDPQSAAQFTISFTAFLLAWVAMMAAMMLPAILPVVRLYAHAASQGRTAPVIVFVAGYFVVWTAVGIPVFVAWNRLNEPLAQAGPWAGRFTGAVALAAGIYQQTPLKAMCLRHCRSPLSFFLHHGRKLDRPSGALIAGARHGGFCLGCCWMLMVLLVAFGTMHLGWMLALTVVIFLEKVAPFGARLSQAAAILLVALGVGLLLHPSFFGYLV